MSRALKARHPSLDYEQAGQALRLLTIRRLARALRVDPADLMAQPPEG